MLQQQSLELAHLANLRIEVNNVVVCPAHPPAQAQAQAAS
jgi:hypothetical protein